MDLCALPAPGLIAELKDCHHTIKERIMPSSNRRKKKPRAVPETPSLTKELVSGRDTPEAGGT